MFTKESLGISEMYNHRFMSLALVSSVYRLGSLQNDNFSHRNFWRGCSNWLKCFLSDSLNHSLEGFHFFLGLQRKSKEILIKMQPMKLCHVQPSIIAPSVHPDKEEKGGIQFEVPLLFSYLYYENSRKHFWRHRWLTELDSYEMTYLWLAGSPDCNAIECV